MIPSFKHGIIASSRPRVVAAANDVTPNAVDWQIVSQNVSDNSGSSKFTEQQITGINTTITLKLTNTGALPVQIYYRVGNTSLTPNTCYDYGTYAYFADIDNDGFYSTINGGSNVTFSVSNNQYVGFGLLQEDESQWTIRNVSDGDALLSTFSWTITPVCG